MHNECQICGNSSVGLVLNDLPMKKCVNCGLVWRQDFDIDPDCYREEHIYLGSEKVKGRSSNSRQRIAIFKKYADLNNLLDVGTGDGIFLKTLTLQGYRNVLGLEPSIKNADFIKDNNLRVIEGCLSDICRVVRENNINTVALFHVIEHLPDPLESLKLVFDGLKKGDKLIIETPDIEAYAFRKRDYRTKNFYNEHLFYFNQKNLKDILVKAGFKAVASGRRDFDQFNMSIKECLFRLGLLNDKIATVEKKEKTAGFSSKEDSALTKLARKVLSRAVVALNRLNYSWIVVEK
ncbi:MAG: class I SAM-dependent methyltransferase [Patescibacteria group bacterium]